MTDSTNEQRPRASLRGKGREILLGEKRDVPAEEQPAETVPASPYAEEVDASALVVTPEEANALLDFAPDQDNVPADEPPVAWQDELAVQFDEPPQETFAAAYEPDSEVPPAGTVEAVDEFDVAELPDDFDAPEDPAAYDESDPLAERDLPAGAAEAPVPTAESAGDWPMPEPEEWPSVIEEVAGEASAAPEAAPAERTTDSPAGQLVPVAGHDGGLVVPEGAVLEPGPTDVTDPFAPLVRRQTALELFTPTSEPDKALLETLVDDERLKQLWQQIDALHEDLVKTVEGDRGAADVYQRELLQASSLLLESRANYDDARAIVNRIRTDLARQQQVRRDIARYRPLLLNYYLGWGIAWAVLMALRGLFTGVGEALGMPIVGAVYYPILFGVLGSLISGYLTLDRHTTRLRDFDPIHISWYLFTPLLGGVMGLLMFLLYSIANQDVLSESATSLERAISWILAVVAGMNQNTVLGQMNDLFKRFSRGSR